MGKKIKPHIKSDNIKLEPTKKPKNIFKSILTKIGNIIGGGVLARERKKLKYEQEKLKLEQERLQFEREKLAFEREKLAFEREKLAFEREKIEIEREKIEIERERENLYTENTKKTTELEKNSQGAVNYVPPMDNAGKNWNMPNLPLDFTPEYSADILTELGRGVIITAFLDEYGRGIDFTKSNLYYNSNEPVINAVKGSNDPYLCYLIEILPTNYYDDMNTVTYNDINNYILYENDNSDFIEYLATETDEPQKYINDTEIIEMIKTKK